MAPGAQAAAQLVELFDRAVKAAERVEEDAGNPAEEARCVDSLKAMRSVPVTTSMLMETQVGKRLRKLSKHKNSKICSVAQEIIESWKKLVAAEAASKSASPAQSAKKVLVKESLKSPGLNSPSPKSHANVDKFVVKTERTVEVKTAVSVRTKSDGQEPAKPGPVPKSGDPTRDRIRELLLEALSKVLTEAEDEDLQKAKSSNVGKISATVESALFKKLGLSSSGVGKSKYRSIMFNLKDPKNPDLRRRVLLGEVAPVDLSTMSAEEMASDQRKQENQSIKEKALFECERGLKQAASTDQFKCSKCKQRKCTYFQMQTRSADEPMTTFVTCVNCNNHWKFC